MPMSHSYRSMAVLRRAAVAGPKAKKARVTDPIEKKVQSMVEAFEDAEQVGLVDMPPVVRTMLKSVMQKTLGHGAAKDQRHKFQTSVANAIGDAFKQTVEIWEGRVRMANASVESADAAKSEKEAVWSAAESSLLAKNDHVKTSQEAVDAAVEALSSATSSLANAQSAADNCSIEKKEKEDQRDRVTTLCKDHFEVLKAGEGDKSLLKPLAAFLKELKAEASLVTALTSTFAKKPEDRGQFDNMVVEQLHGVLTSQMKELEEFLNDFERIISERAAAVVDKKAAVDEAEQHRVACAEVLAAANNAQIEAEAALKDARDGLEEFDQKLEDEKIKVQMHEASLWMAKSNLETFAFLYERVQVATESEISQEAVTSVVEPGHSA